MGKIIKLLLLTHPAVYILPSSENKSRAVEGLVAVFGGRNGNVAYGQIEGASLLLPLCLSIKNILNNKGRLIRIIVEAYAVTFDYRA